MGSQTLPKQQLPVIDFTQENLIPGTSYWVTISRQVVDALENYGTFIAKYEESDSADLHNALFHALEGLFDLPDKTKSDIAERGIKVLKLPTLPIFEAFTVDNPTTIEGARKLSDTIWPNGISENAFSHANLLMGLFRLGLKMVFERYGVEKYYESHLASLHQHYGLTKYRAPRENELDVGLMAHTDKTIANVLDQNLVKGLEVQTKDGEWIAFEPAPSHFVFTAGEALKAISNGRINAPTHRVVIRGNEAKYTVAMATYSSSIIQTPEELIDDEHPQLYKPFSNMDYRQYCMEKAKEKLNFSLEDYCGV